MKILNKICFISIGLSFLAACAPVGNSFRPTNNETGHSRIIQDADTHTRVRANYTISGSRTSFARLVHEVANHTDARLAQSIIDADVQRLNAHDQPTANNPEKLIIRVNFQKTSLSTPGQIILRARMAKANGGLSASEVVQDAPGATRFVGSIFCPQLDCKRVEIRLENRVQSSGSDNQNKMVKNQIGLLITDSAPVVQLLSRRASAAAYVASTMRSLEATLPAARAGTIHGRQKSVVVVEGPSFSLVWLPGAQPQTPQLLISAELFDTSSVISDIKSAEINGKKVHGRLVGNDSNYGDLIIELVDGSETAMLQIEKDKNDADPEDGSDQVALQGKGPSLEPGKAVFPISSRSPKVLTASAALASYSQHPETLKRIDSILKNDPRGVTNFFTHAPNVSPIISKVLEALNVSPEYAYILPVESQYLKSGSFNSTQVTLIRTHANNSAFGPWQIINGRAESIIKNSGENFNFIPVSYMRWDPNDDRGFLVQSTYMAGLYIGSLADMFPHDKALAILAYHSGECAAVKGMTHAARSEKCELQARLRAISTANITLSQVQKYKMVDNVSVDYAFRVLAWREIGQNPSKYGFGNIQPIKNDAYKARLSRPNGPVPPLLQRTHWI